MNFPKTKQSGTLCIAVYIVATDEDWSSLVNDKTFFPWTKLSCSLDEKLKHSEITRPVRPLWLIEGKVKKVKEMNASAWLCCNLVWFGIMTHVKKSALKYTINFSTLK